MVSVFNEENERFRAYMKEAVVSLLAAPIMYLSAPLLGARFVHRAAFSEL